MTTNNTVIIAQLKAKRAILAEQIRATPTITFKTSDDELGDLMLLAENVNEIDMQITFYTKQQNTLTNRIARKINTIFKK